MEKKLKHLEFIQATISRMASNLFFLKGWTVTLIAAVFALASKEANDSYFAIAYMAGLLFWILDAYFLAQERCFRALYDHVRGLDESKIDFSMDTRPFQQERKNTWQGAMLSKTLVVYYGGLALIMVAVGLAIRGG